MPYLAFDLDAKHRLPMLARSTGMSPGDICLGLLDLWEHAWQRKTDTVSETIIYSCFTSDKAVEVLTEFGFIEPVGNDFRVRGAERYLRVSKGRSAGGKKASGNLRRGNKPSPAETKQAGENDTTSPASAGNKPGLNPGSSSSIEHRASNIPLSSKEGAKKPRTPVDPRYGPAVGAIKEACPGYTFSDRDGAALKKLLAHSEPAEIEARWRRALRRTTYPVVRAVHELETHWPHFATDGAAPARDAPVEYVQGYTRL